MPRSKRRISLYCFKPEKAIKKMAEGDEKAQDVLKALCSVTPYSNLYFFILDKNGVYGRDISRMFEGCHENLYYFMELIKAIWHKEKTMDEIYSDLAQMGIS